MTNLVDPSQCESIVGAPRHVTRHLGRAVSSEQTVYILHSHLCKASGKDLRDCNYSHELDRGINEYDWDGWEDKPVVLGFNRTGLIPVRVADLILGGDA